MRGLGKGYHNSFLFFTFYVAGIYIYAVFTIPFLREWGNNGWLHGVNEVAH
jgi:hypothetical protein